MSSSSGLDPTQASRLVPAVSASRVRWLGLLVFALTALVLIGTENRLAIVWDEGYTLGRETRVRWWFQALADPARFARDWRPPSLELVQSDRQAPTPPRADQIDTRAKLFDREVLAWFWPFAREEPHGHPPFYAIVGLVGDLIVHHWKPLPRARLGPILLFSAAAGGLASWLTLRWGIASGLTSALAWILQPHLFAHAHYATYDAILTALWALAILAFDRACLDVQGNRLSRPRWGWLVLFGVLVGCAANTKFTGWFLPLPFLVWCAIYRSRAGWITLLVGGLVGLVVLVALNPAFWSDPFDAVTRFLRSNLTRGRTIPIPVLYLGQTYRTPVESLPWSNTLVWTLFVTPLGFLILGAIGIARAVGRSRCIHQRPCDPLGLLVLGNWAFLMVLRALPHTPGHDGVRLFLPAFGMLAMLAGLAVALPLTTTDASVTRDPSWLRLLRWIGLLAAAEAAVGLALVMPTPLSYYSPAVGGTSGAQRLGMEPTFAWDALSDEARDWLNRHTVPTERVVFATFPTSWLYLKQTGGLTCALAPIDPGLDRWYVLQNRPGAFSPLDRALARSGQAAFTVAARGVPLLWIFPFSEVERCRTSP